MPPDAVQACSFIGCSLQSLFRPGCCDRRAIGLASHWVLLAGGTVSAPGPWRAWSWVSFYTWGRLGMLCTDSQVQNHAAVCPHCRRPEEKHQSPWMIGYQNAEQSADQMCVLSALLCTPLVQLPCICAGPLSMVPALPAPPPRADCPKPFAGRTPSHGQISPHRPGDGLGTASKPGPQTDVAHVPAAGGAAYMDTPNAELPPS